MERVVHDDRETVYREVDTGDGPTVCYIHGAGGSHRIWVRQYGDPESSPAVVPDLSGHGESEDVATAAGIETLDAYADDVVAVCEKSGATVLCGNSMGGAIALWIALERAFDPDALILADSGAKLAVDPTFLETLRDDFAAAIDSLHAPGTLFSDPTTELMKRSADGLWATGQAVTLRDFETCDAFDVRDRLGEIETPTLAVCGENDPLTPPKFHEYLAEELPNGEFHEIAGAAHMPMLERPRAFNGAVRKYLAEVTGTGGPK